MKSLTQTSKNLLSNWFGNHFQAILIIVFLIWTPLLVTGTLEIQHSCHPMINWSNTLPSECNSPQSKFNEKDKSLPTRRPKKPRKQQKNDNFKEQKPIAQSPKPSPTPQTHDTSSPSTTTKQPNQIEKMIELAKDNPEIAGATIGIGIAVGVATIASAPIVVTVGVGLATSAAVWSAIKTVL
jgi:hypothetical protein